MDHVQHNEPSALLPSFIQSSAAMKGLESSNDPSFMFNGALRPALKAGHLASFDENSGNPSPARQSPAESTPEIANAISGRLNLDSVSDQEDDDDSVMDDVSDDLYFDELPPHGLPISSLPTGLCYDERMRYHAEVATINESNYHPEDPRRIFFIYKELCEAGLVDDLKSRKPLVRQPLFRIDAREATEEECCLIHTPKHYEFVKHTSEMENDELIELSEASHLDSIYFNKLSYFSSKLSAGGAIETCRAIFQGKVKNAIAVIRPPGHHAEVSSTMGFCLFNNTCIASRVCQNEFREKCRKILILDWDVHHGNGCQKAFYSDPNILYISIHVHMDGKFYPAGDDGDMLHCGAGPGLGKNVNIPWLTKGMGDGDYMYAFQQVVMPIAQEFDPDFVIVAAGFDAAAGDELGGCFVSPACYAHMTHMLMTLAGGKVAVCLEGGYNFRSISKSALAVTRTLMGEPPDRLLPTAATNSAVEIVRQVSMIQSKYWRCMFPRDPVNGVVFGERLHDIIREWQAKHLYDEYKLSNLHVFRSKISKSFNYQVLATPVFDEKKSLLVIMHDPPEMMGIPNAISGQLELHNTWLADEVKDYIKWAVDHSFGVIDVNIPELITTDIGDQPSSYLKPNNEEAQKQAEKLAGYLWENYIEPSEAENLYFMGVGNAFHGIVKLLCDRDSVHQRVTSVIVFINDNPVRPVHSNENPSLSRWYSQNSNVFVAHTHSLWSKTDRKMSRRYGKVERSPGATLNEMLIVHRDQVFSLLAERSGSNQIEPGERMNETDDLVMSLEKPDVQDGPAHERG
ncbi:hypothetical protein GJ744_008290 [Endocarpon pusillum]|uniref:Histone deacetylase n=1 Tax=Endocarpon pusillum TaxID=364733 RepID=A0A8H7E5G5_9EURO|nr:hypothetical protein GJ744_008290 [Endocarpon pusillum]